MATIFVKVTFRATFTSTVSIRVIRSRKFYGNNLCGSTSPNHDNPMNNIAYGFPPKSKTAKKEVSEKTLATSAKRLAAQLNAHEEAKAIALKPTTSISITVDEVTKSNKMMPV